MEDIRTRIIRVEARQATIAEALAQPPGRRIGSVEWFLKSAADSTKLLVMTLAKLIAVDKIEAI